MADKDASQTPASPTPASPVPAAASPKVESPAVSDTTPPDYDTATAAAPAAVVPAAEENASVTATTAPETAPAVQPHANPQVAELQAIFTTVDVGVIEMVLESVGGSHDRAIESLLQMTDPEFKPDPSAARTEEHASQVDLDEEFARALHIQEQEEARRNSRSGSRSSQPAGQQSRIPEVLPYQPRVRKARVPAPDPYAAATREHQLNERYGEPPAGHGPGGDAPGMIAFEEKIGQFAEAGKQTFSTFFTRAKAKYAELQEQHQTTREEQRQMAEEWRDQGHAHAQGRMVGEPKDKNTTPGGGRGGAGPGLWAQQQQDMAQGRSPGGRSSSLSSQSTVDAAPVAQQTASRRWHPSDAYDDPIPTTRTTSNSSGGRRSPAPGSGSQSPDKSAAPAPGKIDLSKLGFLPKKKVDLMSSSSSPGNDRDPNNHLPTATTASGRSLVEQIPKTPPAELSPHQLGDSDDEDDLDYTENPFDKK